MGIGDWGLGPIPNPQSPIPNPQSPIPMIIFEENNWYIVDGNGIQNSSNGTWFYPEKYFNINEGLIFRIGTTLFECNYLIDN